MNDPAGAGEREAGAEPRTPDEYDLKVDEQVNSFLEIRHKLTYFLIAAAVGSLGFTLSAVLDSHEIRPRGPLAFGLLAVAGVLALAVVAGALLSLYSEVASYKLHLKYRYERKSWAEVSTKDRQRWEKVNRRARWWAAAAFICLGLSVTAQVGYFSLNLYPKEQTMHHYGEDSMEVVSGPAGHQLIFTNKDSQAKIIMLVPRDGVLESGEPLSDQRADTLAAEIAHLLREIL